MIRRTLMNRTELDAWLMPLGIRCVYMHVAEPEDLWDSSIHEHDYHEICYVAGGSGVYDIHGVEYSMEQGDIFFIPKGWGHGEHLRTGESYELRFIMLENVGDSARDVDAVFFAKPMRIRSRTPMLVRRLWDRIMDEIVECNQGYLAVVEACLKMQYALVYRELFDEQSEKQVSQAADPMLRRREFLFERIQTYVRENMVRNFTVVELAEAFHYHPKYLTQLIKRETGKTLTGYILFVRLSCACELLAKTQHSISNILTLCGFANAAHFFRVFKQEIGMTPAQYRRKHQNAPRDALQKF